MYKSRMRSVAMLMAVALTASVSVSAATAATTVDNVKPSELNFAQPAAFTASTQTQTNAVASAPASTQSFVCPPAVAGRPLNPGVRLDTKCPPPPPPPPGFKPDLV